MNQEPQSTGERHGSSIIYTGNVGKEKLKTGQIVPMSGAWCVAWCIRCWWTLDMGGEYRPFSGTKKFLLKENKTGLIGDNHPK